MNAVSAIVISAMLLWQTGVSPALYSTCPREADLAKLSDLYLDVGTAELMRYATVKVQPKTPEACRCKGSVRVRVMVRGDRVFCATALDGHPLLQKAAVDAAVKWRFQKRRQFPKDNVIGTLIFEFK